jgi:hypothetical protein
MLDALVWSAGRMDGFGEAPALFMAMNDAGNLIANVSVILANYSIHT